MELRLHNGKEGQVLYGILVSNEQVFVGQWPYGQINIFEAHYCDPASAALVQLTRSTVVINLGVTESEGQERGGDEGKSYLAGIVATDNVTVMDT